MKAIVRWFDRSSGEGIIRLENGESHFITAAAIPGKKTWFPHTACVYYIDNQEITVELDKQLGWWIPMTPGHFDSEKWASLPQDRLAFKCDEEGRAINGLFSRGAK